MRLSCNPPHPGEHQELSLNPSDRDLHVLSAGEGTAREAPCVQTSWQGLPAKSPSVSHWHAHLPGPWTGGWAGS